MELVFRSSDDLIPLRSKPATISELRFQQETWQTLVTL